MLVILGILIVALFTRAWIEITSGAISWASSPVALFTRAWIEIPTGVYTITEDYVALFTRAWIEILFFAV